MLVQEYVPRVLLVDINLVDVVNVVHDTATFNTGTVNLNVKPVRGVEQGG